VDEKINLLKVGKFGIWIEKENDKFYLKGDVPLPFPSGWKGQSPLLWSASFRIEIEIPLKVEPKDKEEDGLYFLLTDEWRENDNKAQVFLKRTVEDFLDDVFLPRLSEELRKDGWEPEKIHANILRSVIYTLTFVPSSENMRIEVNLLVGWECPADPSRVYRMSLNPWTTGGFFMGGARELVEDLFKELFPWNMFMDEGSVTEFFTVRFPIYKHGTVRITPKESEIRKLLLVKENYMRIVDPSSREGSNWLRVVRFETQINEVLARNLLEKAENPRELVSDIKVIISLLEVDIVWGNGDFKDVIRGMDYFLKYGGIFHDSEGR